MTKSNVRFPVQRFGGLLLKEVYWVLAQKLLGDDFLVHAKGDDRRHAHLQSKAYILGHELPVSDKLWTFEKIY